jgi:hypothetical protein
MMEEVTENEYHELVDNPSQETPQGKNRPMLVVEDNENLLDMDEEEDEIIMLERAIADTPSVPADSTAPADGDAGTVDPKGAAASPPAAATTAPPSAPTTTRRGSPHPLRT